MSNYEIAHTNNSDGVVTKNLNPDYQLLDLFAYAKAKKICLYVSDCY
jgi:hypothetical protein